MSYTVTLTLSRQVATLLDAIEALGMIANVDRFPGGFPVSSVMVLPGGPVEIPLQAMEKPAPKPEAVVTATAAAGSTATPTSAPALAAEVIAAAEAGPWDEDEVPPVEVVRERATQARNTGKDLKAILNAFGADNLSSLRAADRQRFLEALAA